MSRNDSICLSRDQHAELYGRGSQPRLIVDHPSNAPLFGAHAQATLVRAAELVVEAGDESAVVYAACGGHTRRIATAAVMSRKGGAIGLGDWQIEPGYECATAADRETVVHRITRAAEPSK
ncbi:MAG: hypothetical protein PSV46_11675 [Reyranella sp.]|nr:hypothetical protein [Reyranella sp.]